MFRYHLHLVAYLKFCAELDPFKKIMLTNKILTNIALCETGYYKLSKL